MYRDSRDQCPRCGEELLDARAARSCPSCNGLWLGVADVMVMAQQMQNPVRPVDLPFQTDARQPLACPDCSEPMRTLLLSDVPIDSCEKHGLWFDAQELGAVLLRSANQP